MTVVSRTGFASSCQEAVIAVLDAIAAAGRERQQLLTDAKMAVARELAGREFGHILLGIYLHRGMCPNSTPGDPHRGMALIDPAVIILNHAA